MAGLEQRQQNDEGLRLLYAYLNQHQGSVSKQKHDLASKEWSRPEIAIEEVTIWDLVSDDGATASIVIVENGTQPGNATVRIETWTLNGGDKPLLKSHDTISCSSLVWQSLGSRMRHIDLPSLTEEQSTELEKVSTTATLCVASQLWQRQGPFSAVFGGNYWEEIVVADNVIVLARRRGPKRPQDNTVDSDDEEIRNMCQPDGDANSESDSNMGPESETDSDDNAPHGFEVDADPSFGDDPDLNPLLRSPESNVSVASDSSWNEHSDSTSLRSFHLDSDSEDSEADPEVDALGPPHIGALGLCTECKKDMRCFLFCLVCDDGNFSLCEDCWEQGLWCHDEKHQIADCPESFCPTARRLTVKDLKTELELAVFDRNSPRKGPIYRFTQARGPMIPPSPPAKHPKVPLLAWYLGDNKILFANYDTNRHFFRREPGWKKQFPSAPHTPRCLGFSPHFSPCGQILYTITLVCPVNMADSCEGGFLSGLVYSVYTLSSDLSCVSSPLGAKLSWNLQTRVDSISDSLLSVSWTKTYAYVSIAEGQPKLFRLDLAQLAKGTNKVEMLHQNMGVFPFITTQRTLRFLPWHDGSAAVLLGPCQPPKTAPPSVLYLQNGKLGPWTATQKGPRPRGGLIPRIEQSRDNPGEKELVVGDMRIRLLPFPADSGKQIEYKSVDGILTILPNTEAGSLSFRITSHGGRHPVSASGRLMKDEAKGTKTQTDFMYEDAFPISKDSESRDSWVALTNVVDETELKSGKPKTEIPPDRKPRYDPAEVLSTVQVTVYAPPSSLEKGAYWRSRSICRVEETPRSSSDLLCDVCCRLNLTPADFVDPNGDEGEEDDILLQRPVIATGRHYSFQCDGCGKRFRAPCVSYRCLRCLNGNHDLCPPCHARDAAEHTTRHPIRPHLFEIMYHDRLLASVETGAYDTAANWDGRLGSLSDVQKRVTCPLCRLVAHSLDGAKPPPRGADRLANIGNIGEDFSQDSGEDETDPESSQVTLTWRGFGWNSKRWHLQGRYLIAENGRIKGRPLALLSESHPFSPFTAHRPSFDGPLPITLFKRWLGQCEGYHGWTCQSDMSKTPGRNLPNFRVIDVVDRCLVKVSFQSRFVALSYVWGTATQFRALRSNIDLLETKGYLNTVVNQIPKTIIDAMTFTEQMGERYLWVDAICIVQDDPESLTSLIDKMDLIYGVSVFTIIATAGDSSAAGLPGVRPASRVPSQQVETITPEVKLTIIPDLEAKRQESVYDKRAWTFQEMLLSRRRFVFLDDAVYFQCERRTFREDFCARRPNVVSSLLQLSDTSTSAVAYFGPHTGRVYGPGETWERLILAYTRRSLTNQSDTLKAFQGLQAELGQKKGLNFFAGMPIEHLDVSLLWAPRRQATRRKGFPSFSWAGWTGQPLLSPSCPHPLFFVSLADNMPWFIRDTYIEWQGSVNGDSPATLKSGESPAYAWLIDALGLKSQRKDIKTDQTGRPPWNDTSARYYRMPTSCSPNPAALLPKLKPDARDSTMLPPPPGVDSLAFSALLCDGVILTETNPDHLGIYQRDPAVMRTLHITCGGHGTIHGLAYVTDEFELDLEKRKGERLTAVIMSNSMMGLDFKVLREAVGCLGVGMCGSESGSSGQGGEDEARDKSHGEDEDEGEVAEDEEHLHEGENSKEGSLQRGSNSGSEKSEESGIESGEENNRNTKGKQNEAANRKSMAKKQPGTGTVRCYHVLLVRRCGKGVIERVGVGLLGEEFHACTKSLAWEWVYLV